MRCEGCGVPDPKPKCEYCGVRSVDAERQAQGRATIERDEVGRITALRFDDLGHLERKRLRGVLMGHNGLL